MGQTGGFKVFGDQICVYGGARAAGPGGTRDCTGRGRRQQEHADGAARGRAFPVDGLYAQFVLLAVLGD